MAPGLSSAVVLLNSGAGSLVSSEARGRVARIGAAFRASGVDAEVREVDAGRLAEAVREAASSGAEAVVVGGGDGTLSAAAAALAGGPIPLGVLPLGTLNHFAKDLRIPLQLDAAVRTILEGNVREVDLGEVNGRTFINNSSIGLYPRIVADREARRARGRRGKWPAMMRATLGAFRRFPLWRVHLRIGDEVLLRITPLVFVGNNRYEESFLALAGRSCLTAGELHLYVARTTNRRGLVRLALRALAGRLDQARDFEARCIPEVELESARRTLRVAVDGEVVRMEPPLRYRIRRRALRVLAPPVGAASA